MQSFIAVASPASASSMALAVIRLAAPANKSSDASVVLFLAPFRRPGLPALNGRPRVDVALLRGAGAAGAGAGGGGGGGGGGVSTAFGAAFCGVSAGAGASTAGVAAAAVASAAICHPGFVTTRHRVGTRRKDRMGSIWRRLVSISPRRKLRSASLQRAPRTACVARSASRRFLMPSMSTWTWRTFVVGIVIEIAPVSDQSSTISKSGTWAILPSAPNTGVTAATMSG